MTSTSYEEYLRCPFCRYGSHDFDDLDRHVQQAHADKRHRDDRTSHPDSPRQTDRSDLNDFQLAQLLAFEEAGLPSELALTDRPCLPGSDGAGKGEAARKDSSPASVSSPRQGDEEPWVGCVCGERVHFLELDAHADMHAQEDVSMDEAETASNGELSGPIPTAEDALDDISNAFNTNIPSSLRNYDQLNPKTPPSSGKRRVPSLREIFLGTSASPKRKSPSDAVPSNIGKTKRLGRAELGPYAHEPQMPNWLRRMLEEGAKVTITNRIGPDGTLIRVESVSNETPNLVPVLARLSQLDRSVERAFYCSPEVRHVCKMPKEGGFCGYRNIQMLISYIQGAGAPGAEHFPGRVPSILKIQDMVEHAWDKGFNSNGRVETGGIRMTRKYIGTPEAQALFMSLGIPCEAPAYGTTKDVEGCETMLCAVCEYLDDEQTKDNLDKVVITNKPPIYFQHQGHSMTIVGVESRVDGAVNLVVFDPMFNPSPALKKLAFSDPTGFRCGDPERLIKAHRRGERYLGKYREFELLRLQ
ncbi:hypothetical protein A1O3_03429 [Capronia epimyces CBS 606.96]|uniref:UFSP1/2/DUB catalytic domain-containing protein n=1 Tax=Capronia epimyces CBS 606.96 TaxID=1182542 RepID=W9Y1W7_9EURO|nr:uncharacterized protein A1O3_03429 [Capronia epimyces CBS 606.96]EXJ86478.1 hypothetical protein A1O3_03429 [Capronia epimyces CBS 606.96]